MKGSFTVWYAVAFAGAFRTAVSAADCRVLFLCLEPKNKDGLALRSN
jgi:hypothetical protein